MPSAGVAKSPFYITRVGHPLFAYSPERIQSSVEPGLSDPITWGAILFIQNLAGKETLSDIRGNANFSLRPLGFADSLNIFCKQMSRTRTPRGSVSPPHEASGSPRDWEKRAVTPARQDRLKRRGRKPTALGRHRHGNPFPSQSRTLPCAKWTEPSP